MGLLEAGAAVPDRKRRLLRFDPSVPVARELQPFRHVESERIAVMHAGRIEQAGTPRQIYEQPASLVVARFIGQCNLPQGSIDVSGLRFRTQGGLHLAIAKPVLGVSEARSNRFSARTINRTITPTPAGGRRQSRLGRERSI